MLFRNGSSINTIQRGLSIHLQGKISRHLNCRYYSAIANNTNTVNVTNGSTIHKINTLLIVRSNLSAFAPSRIDYERIKINVPTMGDSITEGTIVEWCIPIGGYANEGDVVALIETDKVTVDIKAEESGVVITHYGNVDDNVEVGQPLYQIDTEAQPTVAADSNTASATSTEVSDDIASVSPAIATEEANITAKPARTPSIQFLGKEGWMKRLQGISEEEDEEEPLVTYMDYLPPMYGRPDITEDEMDALILGGASLAPELIKKSSNPVFK